jgi:hypothetical protein
MPLLRLAAGGEEMTDRYLYRLAVLLGTTPAALREQMTAADLAEWIAYMRAGQ